MIPKRGAIAGFLTVVGLVLLLNFKTPETPALPNRGTETAFGGASNPLAGATALDGGSSAGGGNTGSGGGTSGGAGGGAATPAPTSGSAAFSGTLTGAAERTPFGPVQVQVTIQNGKITDVKALELPSNDRNSQAIASYAAPQLRSEVLQAQSAQIDMISGATWTSQGYIQSLQSALDQLPS